MIIWIEIRRDNSMVGKCGRFMISTGTAEWKLQFHPLSISDGGEYSLKGCAHRLVFSMKLYMVAGTHRSSLTVFSAAWMMSPKSLERWDTSRTLTWVSL